MKEFIKVQKKLSSMGEHNARGLYDTYYENLINRYKPLSVLANRINMSHRKHSRIKSYVYVLYHNAPAMVRMMTDPPPYNTYTKLIRVASDNRNTLMSLSMRNLKTGLRDFSFNKK